MTDFIWHKSKLEQIPWLLTSRVHGFAESPEYKQLGDLEKSLPGVVCGGLANYMIRALERGSVADLSEDTDLVLSSAIDAVELLASSLETAIRSLVVEEIYETLETRPELWERIKEQLKPRSLALYKQGDPSKRQT